MLSPQEKELRSFKDLDESIFLCSQKQQLFYIYNSQLTKIIQMAFIYHCIQKGMATLTFVY